MDKRYWSDYSGEEMDTLLYEVKSAKGSYGLDSRIGTVEEKVANANDGVAEAKDMVDELKEEIKTQVDTKTLTADSANIGSLEFAISVGEENKPGWYKFATYNFKNKKYNYERVSALLFISNHNPGGKFISLVGITIETDLSDYAEIQGVTFTQIAGKDITSKLCYEQNPETKDLTFYIYKWNYDIVRIGVIYNSPLSDGTRPIIIGTDNINVQGGLIKHPVYATYATVDLSGYATKEELSKNVYTKPEIDNRFANYVTLTDFDDSIREANGNIEYLDAHLRDAETKLADVYTKPEIDNKISSVYKYRGSCIDIDDLINQLQSKQITNPAVGDVWNIHEACVIPSGFYVTGHNNVIKAGDNVALVEVIPAGAENTIYTFDNLAGTVDLSNYYTKTEVNDKTNYAEEFGRNALEEIQTLRGNVYTKTEVDNKLLSYSTTKDVSSMIESAIGTALEGEY